MVRTITGGQLLHALDQQRDELVDAAVVAVECGGATDVDARQLEARLAGLPAVVVAVGPSEDEPLACALDVVASDSDELQAYEAAVREHHDAAVALAALLRNSPHRSTGDALVAESATYSTLQAGADHRAWLARRPTPEPVPDDERDVVLVEREGDTLHITLNRPHVHNAYDAATRDALLDALGILASDESLAATIDGRGPSFCSGGDLREFGTAHDPAAAHVLRLRRNVGRVIDAVSDRVTVRVHGHCVGAGVELAAFAGRVVAAADATFRLPELGMGLVPGAGGTVSLPRRIGRQRTLHMALSGAAVDAEQALRWGLVDAIE